MRLGHNVGVAMAVKTDSTRAKPSGALPARTDDGQTCTLALQGGGAPGSYQAGAYEQMTVDGLRPSWVAGVSNPSSHSTEGRR